MKKTKKTSEQRQDHGQSASQFVDGSVKKKALLYNVKLLAVQHVHQLLMIHLATPETNKFPSAGQHWNG